MATFKEEKKMLEQKHEKEIADLIRKFALEQSPKKIGDKATDHMKTIIVEKIKTTTQFGVPTCVYEGTSLKKDGTPKQIRGKYKNLIDVIWQMNLLG
jgi:hypothetical protein